MILSDRYYSLDRALGRAIIGLVPSTLSPLEPDEGFVFVFTSDNRQVFDQDDNSVQVPEEFANA
jgi:hypothetical protein